jgi:hypothetical protein
MNKFRLNRATVVGLLSIILITLTVIHLTTVHAEKTGVYSQSGGTSSETEKTYAATASDQSGIYINNSSDYTLTQSTITKTGATSSIEDSDYYGLNAGALAEGGSTVTLTDSTVITDAKGANGVFAYGEGTSVTINNVTIKTAQESSRGIAVTDKGVITANSCNFTTTSAYSPAIASGRGGGTLTVRGGTFTTFGTDSPPIYCTGAFEIMGATLRGLGAEVAVIEGANSITLWDCNLLSAKNSGVLIFQSTADDATEKGTFNMTGGSLTAAAGPLFFVSNLTAEINLTAVTTTAASGTLVQATAANWGTSGSNGGAVILNAEMQTLTGDLICDSISSITVNLKNGSNLIGGINTAALTLDETSTWIVTKDSYLTALNGNDTTFANIDDNGHTIYYDSSLSGNDWLGGNTYDLADGGKIIPWTSTPSPTATDTPSVSPTESVTPSPTPTLTPTPSPSDTSSPSPSPSPINRRWSWWPWSWWGWWRR